MHLCPQRPRTRFDDSATIISMQVSANSDLLWGYEGRTDAGARNTDLLRLGLPNPVGPSMPRGIKPSGPSLCSASGQKPYFSGCTAPWTSQLNHVLPESSLTTAYQRGFWELEPGPIARPVSGACEDLFSFCIYPIPKHAYEDTKEQL